jgi:CYTH domain-containing protein
VSVEIERRFLIERARPAAAQAVRTSRIRQGYVAIDDRAGVEVRVREIDDRRLLAVKRGSGEARSEVEFEIDRATFEELWELTADRRIDKRRHFIRGEDGLVFELDVYDGSLAGFAAVEVEFDSPGESAAFSPPGWFGREVTGDARYSNARLAVDGLPVQR